jgi:hypothetical protein
MSDDLVRRLQNDWQSQQYDVSQALRRLQRTRWVPHFILALEVLGCGVALGVGLWFAWMASHHTGHTLLYALSAAILLVSVPVLGVATAWARRSSLAWHDETPESMLRIGIRRSEASLRAMRVGRWHLAVIAGFVALLWALQWFGLIDALEFLIFYSSICLVVSLCSGMWMLWRTKTVSAQRDAYVRLLADFRD